MRGVEADGGGALAKQIVETILPAWVGSRGGAWRDPLCVGHRSAASGAATLRVQAQRVYLAARLERAGLLPGGAASGAFLASDALMRFLSADGGEGLVRAVAEDGRVVDPSRNFEDHAWMVSALAQVHTLTGSDDVLLIADMLLEFIESRLSTGSIGFCADDQGSTERGQAGHLRLFEALLTLQLSSGAERYLAAAGKIHEVFRYHFFDRQGGGVIESLGRDWRPTPKGAIAAFQSQATAQWIAQLGRHHAIVGSGQTLGLMAALAENLRARRNSSGFVASSHDRFGAPIDASCPLASQLGLCAAIRAMQAAGEGGFGAAGRLEALIAGAYLDVAPRGCWIERLSAAGTSEGAPLDHSTLVSLIDHAAGDSDGALLKRARAENPNDERVRAA